MNKVIKITATILQFVIALIFAVGYFTPAQGENIPSPSIKDMYRIESEYMKLSDFPNKLVLYDVVMIDIDAERAKEADEITATLYLPLIPENLDDIILFDGYHVAHFKFERVNEGCVRIFAKGEDIAVFDGTVGLYLFVTGYEN